MLENTKLTTSRRNSAHQVRGIAIVGGQQVQFESFRVEQSGFDVADSFEISLPFFIRDNARGDQVLANGPGFQSILLTQKEIPVQIYLGFVENPQFYTIKDLTKIMDGFMDTARWSLSQSGEVVTLSGRNVIGRMLDTKLTEKFPNLTASGIAEKIAGKYHLSTAKITKTNKLAGTFYNSNSTVLSNDSNEWDLLLFLAKQENFIVRVKNDQLLFGPYGTVTGYENQEPISYTWGYDIESLEIERSPQATKEIIVKVISYDRNSKARIEETAKNKTAPGTKKGDEAKPYLETYVIPGLTREQVQKKAAFILNELTRTELIGNMNCAGNPELAIDRKISIHGAGDGISRSYYINRVTHGFDLSGGYKSEVSFSSKFMIDDQPSQ